MKKNLPFVLLGISLVLFVGGLIASNMIEGKTGSLIGILTGLPAALLAVGGAMLSTVQHHNREEARAEKLVTDPETQGETIRGTVDYVATELRSAGVEATVTEGETADGSRTVTLAYPAAKKGATSA